MPPPFFCLGSVALALAVAAQTALAAPPSSSAGPTTAATTTVTTFESGDGQTALLELFTSEGCSSCPPAEARLGKLRDDPGLWKTFVPVAFHVDYWDNLGWKDRFAAAAFTRRQREYAARWRSDTVYTPAFVRNGREGFNGDDTAGASGTAASHTTTTTTTTRGTAKPGRLRVQVAASGEIDVSYQPADPAKGDNGSNARNGAGGPWTVEAAPLAGGVTSDVRRGENAGRKLAHDFVALDLLTAPLERRADGQWTAKLHLPATAKLPAPASALAVWVHPAGDPAPLQAAGGWLAK